MSEQFQILCLNKLVLKNVLVGLHKSRGDPVEKEHQVKNHPDLLPLNNLFGGFIKN